MRLATSEYVLEIEGTRFKLRQHTSHNEEEMWLNGRQGELSHSTLAVRPRNPDRVPDNNTTTAAGNGAVSKAEGAQVFFDGRDIGFIPLSDSANLRILDEIVVLLNERFGPTDLQTAKVAAVLARGRDLVNKKETITVHTVTWNVFGSLSKLSPTQVDELVDYDQDVIVLNFQESDPLNRNLVANQQTLQSTIEKVTRPSHNLVSSVQLLGLMTLVLVKSDLKVSNVRKDSSGVGFLRVWGNKGAVLTRFTIYNDDILGGGAEFAVVNCHLSAGEKPQQNVRRQWELREISSKFCIDDVIIANPSEFETAAYEFDADQSDSETLVDETRDEEPAQDEAIVPQRYRKQEFGIDSDSEGEDHGQQDGEEAHKQTNESRKSSNPEKVLDTNKTLPELPPQSAYESDAEEPDLASPSPPEKPQPPLPSRRKTITEYSLPQFIIFSGDLNYRVNMGTTNVIELAKNGKFQTILEKDFCSRLHKENKILVGFQEHPIAFSPTYKFQLGSHRYDCSVRTPSYTDRIFYRGDMEYEISKYTSLPLTLSDHRPVVSQAQVRVLTANNEKYSNLVDSAYRMVDRAENLAIPNVEIEPNAIEVETPIFSIPCETVTISSKSSRPVSWHIVPNDNITIIPDSGIIEPGNSQRISLKSFMGANTKEINEIIVVAVEGGSDRFISTIFRKAPTFIGQNVAEMCKKGDKKDNLPQNIWQCVDYLWSRVVPQMFVGEGELSIIRQVIEWLDKGQDLDVEVLDAANSTTDGAGSTSVARVLYLILINMPKPLIPESAYRDAPEKFTDEYVLEKIPSDHSNVAIYLFQFFRHIIDFGCPVTKLAEPIEHMLLGRSTEPELSAARGKLVTDLFSS